MTVDAWITYLVLGVMLLAIGFGVLAGIPREVLMAWRMRVCGWERDAAIRNGGAAPRAVPGRAKPTRTVSEGEGHGGTELPR